MYLSLLLFLISLASSILFYLYIRGFAALEVQIAREKILKPKLEIDQVKFFFQKFLNGDASDIKFRQALIDTFINKVHLFQDKLCIFCNAKDSKIEIPLHDTMCSYKGHMSNHSCINTNTR